MVPICIVAGPSGSGKTTLVEHLLSALTNRGVVTATVKHHRGRIQLDRPGKDTWRHRRAGARATFLVTEGEVVGFFDRPSDLELRDLACMCPAEVQLLLVEGFKDLTGYPRIEVVRQGVQRKLSCSEEVVCVATDVENLSVTCPVFPLDDAEGIAGLLVQRLLSGRI